MKISNRKLYILMLITFALFPFSMRFLISDFKNDTPVRKKEGNDDDVKVSGIAWDTAVSVAVGDRPSGLAAGDANNDGFTDIVVSSAWTDKIFVLTGTGTNSWNPSISLTYTGEFPSIPVIADVNNDGRNDIVVANDIYWGTLSIFYGKSDHTWQSEFLFDVGYHPTSVAIGDVDGDSDNDIVVTSFTYGGVDVYRWSPGGPTYGNWEYTDILDTEYNPDYVAIGDVNEDGKNDIVTSHNGMGGILSINLRVGSGWASNDIIFDVPNYPDSLFLADVDNNGKGDIVCGLSNNKIAIIRYNSSASWWDVTTKTVGTHPKVFVGDLNNDGKNDIVTSNSADDTISILIWNSGTSDWKKALTFPVGGGPSNPTIKDFNNDGFKDIAVANYDDDDISILYGFQDTEAPSITINAPLQNGNYTSAPDFNISITDDHYVHQKWYLYNADPSKHFFAENGPFLGWTTVPDGTLTITFYANDTAGNVNSDFVIINKDNTNPTINVLSPIVDDAFDNIAPSYFVEISDENLDLMWYNYDWMDGTKRFFLENGTLAGWDVLAEGYIPLRFYANDTFGNVHYQQVNIIKDTSAPLITIYHPSPNQYFSSDAPSYDLDFDDYTLDSYWYTLNESSPFDMPTTYGNINELLWDSFPSSSIRITFYANDSFSRISSKSVLVIKDLDDPIININSPVTNQLIGRTPPLFDLSITEPNLDESWYSLDNGLHNYSLTTWCNQTAWEHCGDGDVTITFYAKDMVGHQASAEITVRKDGTPPQVTINSPDDYQEFITSTPPNFDLTIPDSDLDCIWYTLDNGNTIYLCELSGQIDSDLWKSLGNGEYTIRFYANDTIGNYDYAAVSIVKNIETSGDLTFIITISAISVGAIIGIAGIVWGIRKRK